MKARSASLILRGGTVVVSAAEGTILERADILVEDGAVAAVGADLHARDARTLDVAGRIVMPGLVNAHSHSYASMLKGTVPGEPLDLFVMNAMARRAPRPARSVYVGAAIHALELLANGVTAVVDHFRYGALPAVEAIDAAMQAYADAGIRAVVAPMYEDKPYLDSLPIDRDALPPEIAARWRDVRLPPPEAYFERMGDIARKWHGTHPALDVMVGVDGPQRCTDRLLALTGEFVARHDIGFHTHLLEAKTQALMGAPERLGPLVERLDRNGLVGPQSSFAHFVWPTEAEIERVAERGASVVHNPGSNLLLGSGVAPIARLRRAGVHVALGTDSSSGSRGSVFEQAKLAALLTHLTETDCDRWIGARDALAMATAGGARVLGLQGALGEIRPGRRADLVVLDARGADYAPRGDLWSHLAMYETGANVETVLVEGEPVIEAKRHVRLDVPALLAEAAELAAADTRANAAHLAQAAAERSAMKALLEAALDAPLGIDRYARLR